MGVVREGVLGLGHADRQVAETLLLELLELLEGTRGVVDAVRVVDLGGDGRDLVLDGGLHVIGEAEVVGLLAQAHDLLGKGATTLAALGPHLGERHVDTELVALLLDKRELRGGVRGEGVDGDDDG